jgi:tetratricopeptide (TPR) repeat protein
MPTRPTLRSRLLLTAMCTVTACASAGKRLEQGLEAEAAGAYYDAAVRYLEALEKDETLVEARERAMVASDSAFAHGMAEADDLLARRKAEEAGGQYLALDRLLTLGRQVGVQMPAPATYTETRRSTFDSAIDELMRSGEDARRDGRWSDARGLFQRARRDFSPSFGQRAESEEAEARSLIDWAEAEEAEARFRRAYDLAAEAMDVSPSQPADLAGQASSIQDRALVSGTHVMAVFPITATTLVQERMDGDLDQQLADLLELDYWRSPPLFVVVEDPIVVRQLTRRLTPAGGPFRPGRVLTELGADFGVLVELVALDLAERDARRGVREARTHDGRKTNYTVESGTLAYSLEASVILVDRRGREITDFRASATENGRFERGLYRSDVGELDLGRNELRLFDAVVQRERVAELEAQLLAELADRVADQVYSRVLAEIP